MDKLGMLEENSMRVHDFASLSKKAAANQLNHVNSGCPIWIFGAGNFGKNLAEVLRMSGADVAGFVETIPRRTEFNDLPVLDFVTLAKKSPGAQVVLGVFNRGAALDDLVRVVRKNGFSPPIMPWDVYDQFSESLGWKFWLSKKDFLRENLERISHIAMKLADSESREILFRICAFRLGLDLAFASYRSHETQYFNQLTITPLEGKKITYLDLGAYNGDSYIELLTKSKISCKQVFLLEPDPENYSELVKNISNKGVDAVCIPMAASSRYEFLKFSSGKGEGGSIGSDGDINIAAVGVDQLLPSTHVDLIKVDVEGAEAGVLKGAEKLITRCRPIVAMSLYHNPQDIWELPDLLFGKCEDYKFYIRQHYFNTFDSVLYAIPNQHL